MNILKRDKLTKNEVVTIRRRLCPDSIIRVEARKIRRRRKGPRGKSKFVGYYKVSQVSNIFVGSRVEAFRGKGMMRRTHGRWRVVKMVMVEGEGIAVGDYSYG